jgi:hypothetical protein
MSAKVKDTPVDIRRDAVKVTATLQVLSAQLIATLADIKTSAEELESNA